jgi:hypothetical protein
MKKSAILLCVFTALLAAEAMSATLSMKELLPFKEGEDYVYVRATADGGFAVARHVSKVTARGNSVTAIIEQTMTDKDDKKEVMTFVYTISASEIMEESVPDGKVCKKKTERKILAAPVKLGNAWKFNGADYKIESVTEEVELPSGKFSNCVKVAVGVMGKPDWDTAIYYLPGVGMIKIQAKGENIELHINPKEKQR